jgi:hypothetical protein
VSGLQRGDRVDIVIRGARVISNDDDVLVVEHQIDIPIYEGNWRRVSVCTLSDAVSIKRLDPVNWPPKRGDVWSSVDPVLWFAHLDNDGELRMVNDAGAVMSVDEFRDGYAGRLVLRDGKPVPAVSS